MSRAKPASRTAGRSRSGEVTTSAKGAAVRGTLTFLESRFGADLVSQTLASLPAEPRRRLRELAPTDEVPYAELVALWTAADALVAEMAPDWAQESGAFSVDSGGVHLSGGILRKTTPKEFLTQSVSLFGLHYHPGSMEVVEVEPQRVVLRLVGFEPVTPLFCLRQTGGLRRAIEIAGGGAARTRHVRCSIEGDAFCEWELRWQHATTKTPGG